MGGKTYAAAVRALESLLSKTPGRTKDFLTEQRSIEPIFNYLSRLDLLGNLRSLKVIHVAGTKGKGSVCSLAESVLRNCGLKTGMYTSPHLLDVRERIRVDGVPVDKNVFMDSFWHCWERLEETERTVSDAHPFPTYFRFLTLVGFHVFISQRVDIAIVEVGIGGRYDATNVVSPVACGISSLGYDHMNMLGDTISEIAFAKAGIMKPGVPVFTSPQQHQAAMDMLVQVAAEVGAPLSTSQPLPDDVHVGLRGRFQRANAALALDLCNVVLRQPRGTLTPAMAAGLTSARWDGRCQVLPSRCHPERVQFYLDGAHTEESMYECAVWFGHDRRPSAPSARSIAILFVSHDRDPKRVLSPLVHAAAASFDTVIFCPPDSNKDHVIVPPAEPCADRLPSAWHQHVVADMQEAQRRFPRQTGLRNVWKEMTDRLSPAAADTPIRQQDLLVVDSVEAAIGLAENLFPTEQTDVLVTGSLYLVGDVLRHVAV